MINYSIAIMGTKPGTKKENITETKAYGVAQAKESIDIKIGRASCRERVFMMV